MLAWRVTKYLDLSGRGGLAASGRWHTRPQLIVYFAEEAQTAFQEVLRHVGGRPELLPEDYQLLKIVIPDHLAITSVDVGQLDPSWVDVYSGAKICRPIGDEWLRSHSTPLLRVPSAVCHGLFNILMNPIFREAEEISIAEVFSQPFKLAE